jgi:hypothetical protein
MEVRTAMAKKRAINNRQVKSKVEVTELRVTALEQQIRDHAKLVADASNTMLEAAEKLHRRLEETKGWVTRRVEEMETQLAKVNKDFARAMAGLPRGQGDFNEIFKAQIAQLQAVVWAQQSVHHNKPIIAEKFLADRIYEAMVLKRTVKPADVAADAMNFARELEPGQDVRVELDGELDGEGGDDEPVD